MPQDPGPIIIFGSVCALISHFLTRWAFANTAKKAYEKRFDDKKQEMVAARDREITRAVADAQQRWEFMNQATKKENEILRDQVRDSQRLSEARRDALVGIRGMLDHADLDNSADADIRRSLYEKPPTQKKRNDDIRPEPVTGKTAMTGTTIQIPQANIQVPPGYWYHHGPLPSPPT